MSMIPFSPLGRAGVAARPAAQLSPAADQALDAPPRWAPSSPTQLAQHIQRLPDAAARRQLLDSGAAPVAARFAGRAASDKTSRPA